MIFSCKLAASIVLQSRMSDSIMGKMKWISAVGTSCTRPLASAPLHLPAQRSGVRLLRLLKADQGMKLQP